MSGTGTELSPLMVFTRSSRAKSLVMFGHFCESYCCIMRFFTARGTFTLLSWEDVVGVNYRKINKSCLLAFKARTMCTYTNTEQKTMPPFLYFNGKGSILEKLKSIIFKSHTRPPPLISHLFSLLL